MRTGSVLADAGSGHTGGVADWLREYEAVRSATMQLVEPLSPEDCVVQSMAEASPVKWHLAHTSWFFETFVLEVADPGHRPFDPAYRRLFNSYYNTVGEQHPRPERGFLTRPGLDEVMRYRRFVDERVQALLRHRRSADILPVLETGLHHEQQHQELILTDLKHLFSLNPIAPIYRDGPAPLAGEPGELRWRFFPEGLRHIGDAGDVFAFDNERPRHRAFVEAFEIGSRLVTNGEYLEFIRDGGYERPELWLSDGWDAVRSRRWRGPAYWEARDGTWNLRTLTGERPVEVSEPVCHVSYYEADAFARWAGVRLPTEEEWEVVAQTRRVRGNFAENGWLHPLPLGQAGPDVNQLFGDVWEWTGSPYRPYPGYEPPPGPLGEYNGKFMANQMVLRGGSCVTPASHIRATYRNFFPPSARWQFTGIRLARDAGAR